NGSGRYTASGTYPLTEDVNDVSGYKYQAINQFTQGTPPAVTIGNLLPPPTTGGSISIDGNNYNINQFADGGVPGDLVFPNGTFDYLLNAPDSAKYTLTLSTSTSLDTAQIQVILDNQPIATLNLPNTGGNTNFVSLPPLQLAPGNTPYALSP